MGPFSFVAHRIDRLVLRVVSGYALAVLKNEYDCTTAHQILWRAWVAFGRDVTAIRSNRTLARATLTMAVAAAALHQAMLHAGAGELHAAQTVAEIARKSYTQLARTPWRIARLLTLDSVDRMPVVMRLVSWLVLPGRNSSTAIGDVTMHISRCPAAALYRERGIGHLLQPLVCGPELAAASVWHARAEALPCEGHDSGCTLRFRSFAPQHGGHHASQPIY